VRIRGSGGIVRIGYQTAAQVGDWTLTRTQTTPEPAYQAEATLIDADAFWVQQRPMDLELTIGRRRWVWAGLQPDIAAQSLTVALVGGPSIH
jgi:hypothetical protein